MGLNVFPTNIGGVQLPFNQLEGPLASLFSTDRPQNLSYPSDLASNPTMCHAVQFSVHDWTTELSGLANGAVDAAGKLIDSVAGGKIGGIISEAFSDPAAALSKVGDDNTLPNAAKLIQAQTYKQKLSQALAHINLYMPDTLYNSFDSFYSTISLTEKLGTPGVAISSAQDLFGKVGSTNKDVIDNVVNAYNSANLGMMKSKTAQGLASYLTGSELLESSFGVGINPQVQLLYKGVDLRKFTLEFMFTPKNAREAEATKSIVDAFNYFSLPSLSGQSGQFLVAPQIFKIKFAFTGKSGVAGAIGNAFEKAFNSIGLGFINTSNQSETISGAANAKIFSIPHPCVLRSVNVDYAPNGWAAYNDGHPIQTRMTLTFEETQIVTKESYSGNMNQGWLNETQRVQSMVSSGFKQETDGSFSMSEAQAKAEGWL